MSWEKVQNIRCLIQDLRECGQDPDERREILEKALTILNEYPNEYAEKYELVENIQSYLDGNEMVPRLLSDTQYALLDAADGLK